MVKPAYVWVSRNREFNMYAIEEGVEYWYHGQDYCTERLYPLNKESSIHRWFEGDKAEIIPYCLLENGGWHGTR